MSTTDPAPKRYKTDDELKTLALDIIGGRIFGTWMMAKGSEHLISTVFMPLMFSGETTIEQFKTDEVVHFYEHMNEAGPRGINGYPMFMSAHGLTKADWSVLVPMLTKMQTALNEVHP